MFTGIIESIGQIVGLEKEAANLHVDVQCDFAHELKVDQSIAHNGVCLTVVHTNDTLYRVTAIQETLDKTNLGHWSLGDAVNLERGMKLGDRLDGHIVQGHVDQTGTCVGIKDAEGSTYYTFQYDTNLNNITIEKGSITVNGVSLTVVNSERNQFSVAIIPYTKEHTTFQYLKKGDVVNLEFDVIGKYVTRLQELNRS